MTIVRLMLVGALAAALVLPMTACTAQETSAPNGSAEEPAAPQPDGEGTVSTDGEALVAEKCSQCHSIDQVNAAQKDEAGWQSTVERMERNGLELTDDERETIVEWLAERDAAR